MKIKTIPIQKYHLFFVILLGSSVAFAQEQVNLKFMNEILITGSRDESAADELAIKSDVIDSQEIEDRLTNNIDALTRYTPGVEVGGSAGSRFGLTGFTIRGIGGDRVKIMVDGIDQANDFDFGPFLSARRDYFEVDTLKAAEIIRGPASVLYGSDALAGIVGYRTKDPDDFLDTDEDESHASVKTGYRSSDNSILASLNLADRSGDLESMLIYTHRQGHQQQAHSTANAIGEQRPSSNPSDFDSDNLLTKLNYQLNSNHHLGLTLEQFKVDEQFDIQSNIGFSTLAFPGAPPLVTNTLSNTADDEKKRQRISLELESEVNNALFDKSLTRLGWQNSDTSQLTQFDRLVGIAGSPLIGQQRTRRSDYEESGYFLDQQFDKHTHSGELSQHFTYGLDLKNIDSESLRQINDVSRVPALSNLQALRDFPKSETREYGFYLQDKLMMGQFTLIPGLRYDYFKLTPNVDNLYLASNPLNSNPDSFNEDNFSLKLGGIYSINQQWSIFAQYAEGFKAPQADQIFGEFQNQAQGYQIIANPDLKPESSRGFDFGVRHQGQRAGFEVTAFYTKYDDFIEQSSFFNPQSGFLTFQFQNREKAVIKGLELKSELYLGQFSDNFEGFKLTASAAYASGDTTNTNGIERPLNSVAPLKIIAGINYNSPSAVWGGELLITSVQGKRRIDQQDDTTLFSTPGYTVTDLTFYYHLSDKISLNAGIFNLGDKKYWRWEDVRGLEDNAPGLERFTQPGRNYGLNISWEF